MKVLVIAGPNGAGETTLATDTCPLWGRKYPS